MQHNYPQCLQLRWFGTKSRRAQNRKAKRAAKEQGSKGQQQQQQQHSSTPPREKSRLQQWMDDKEHILTEKLRQRAGAATRPSGVHDEQSHNAAGFLVNEIALFVGAILCSKAVFLGFVALQGAVSFTLAPDFAVITSYMLGFQIMYKIYVSKMMEGRVYLPPVQPVPPPNVDSKDPTLAPIIGGLFGGFRKGPMSLAAALALVGFFTLMHSLGRKRDVEDEWVEGTYLDEAVRGDRHHMFRVCFASPLLEEFVCRGLVFARLLIGSGAAVAHTVNALLFGALHPDNFVGSAVFAAVLAQLYYATGSFGLPVAIHVFENSRLFWRFAMLGPLNPLGRREDRDARRRRLRLGHTISKFINGFMERVGKVVRTLSFGFLFRSPLLENGKLDEKAVAALDTLVEEAVAGAAQEDAATRIAAALLEANGRNSGLRNAAEKALRNACDMEIHRRTVKWKWSRKNKQEENKDGSTELDLEALRYSETMLEDYIEDFNATLGEVYEFAGEDVSSEVPSTVYQYLQQLALLSPKVAARVLGLENSIKEPEHVDSPNAESTDIPQTAPAQSTPQAQSTDNNN